MHGVLHQLKTEGGGWARRAHTEGELCCFVAEAFGAQMRQPFNVLEAMDEARKTAAPHSLVVGRRGLGGGDGDGCCVVSIDRSPTWAVFAETGVRAAPPPLGGRQRSIATVLRACHPVRLALAVWRV